MKVSSAALKSVAPKIQLPVVNPYKIPSLSNIKVEHLPNNGFGVKNYYIPKTKYGHWPVYKKVQNTKITTEIKRINGDVEQFRRDLVTICPQLNPANVTVNKIAGYVNIKGDVVDDVKRVFDETIKTD